MGSFNGFCECGVFYNVEYNLPNGETIIGIKVNYENDGFICYCPCCNDTEYVSLEDYKKNER